MSLINFAGSALAAVWRDRHYSADQFRRLQRKKLVRLVNHACRRVPFYAQRYRHVDCRDFALTDLPPVTKAELMARFADSVTDSAVELDEAIGAATSPGTTSHWIRNQYLVSITSGTTGLAGYFLNDRRSWAVLSGAVFARTIRDRLTPWQLARFSFGRRYRMAFVVSGIGAAITTQVGRETSRASGLVVDSRRLSIMDPVEKNVELLNRFRPHYMHGYSTYIELLAHQKLSGRLRFSPEFVSLGSEPVTSRARETIQLAFPRAIIVEQYGTTECALLANQCFEGRLHANVDCCIIEPVDEQDRPVPQGELSHHILVTNLMNLAQPIIRYRVDDGVVLTGERCPCGRPLPVVKVHGRSDDPIWLWDVHGDFQFHSPIAMEILFVGCPGLVQFQLVHERQNELRLRFVCDSEDRVHEVASRLRSKLGRYFAQHGLQDAVRLRVEPVAAIERPRAGQKVRQIQSRVEPPEPENRPTTSPASVGPSQTKEASQAQRLHSQPSHPPVRRKAG